MKLTELRDLEIGTKVRLKGTSVIFEVRQIDNIDDFRPVYLRLISSDKPVLTRLYANGDHTILYPNKRSEEAWVFNNKTIMRDAAGYSRSELEKASQGYRIATVRDLEVVEVTETVDAVDAGSELDKHIDPRDLIYRSEPETQMPVELLPVSKARELSNANDPAMIELINHAIEYEANLGLRVVKFCELPPVPEAIKEKYRQAGYTVTKHTIKW